MLQIPQTEFERIIAQGREGKPLEICGLLGGRRMGEDTHVVEAYPVESDDKSPLTYTLNSTGYIWAIKAIETQGLEVVGIYHTHPATVAYPSKTDVARAHWGDTDDLLFPDYSYLIVSLRDEANPEPHSFKINGRRIPQDIEEETVSIFDAFGEARGEFSRITPPMTNETPCVVPATLNGHQPPPIEQLGRDSVSILGYIGNTPLLCLSRLTRHLKKVRVYAKAEYLNPGGSVKDRAALNMVLHGEATGELTPEKTILDSTSGNTGIAYAMIGAARGYKVKLVMPGNVSPERRKIVKLYGAEVELSSALEGSDGAIMLAREIYNENPDLYFKPDQYNNEFNPLAHYKGTGPEIWNQTQGLVTHFLATIGTSGTLMGTGRYLKEQNPDVQIVAVEPDHAMHGIEGLKHMATSIKPGIYHEDQHDDKIPAATEDAYDMAERLAREEGIFVGFSAGAAVWAAVHLAEKLEAEGREAVIVTILCDRGDRYLSMLARDE